MLSVNLFDHDQTALRQLDGDAQERLRALDAPVPMQTLRRTGRRPYAFNGTIMATVCGVTPALPFWYEINVYRSVIDTYVSDVRMFNKDGALADLFRVEEHDELEDAFTWFERYDAAADLMMEPDGNKPDGGKPESNAVVALRAARLQVRVNEIRAHYAVVMGDLLHALQPQLR